MSRPVQSSRVRCRPLRSLAGFVLAGVALTACAGSGEDMAHQGAGGGGPAAALERLDEAGLRALETYGQSPAPKAFAVAADGGWGWVAAVPDLPTAEAQALSRCAGVATAGPCRVVAWDAGGRWDDAGPLSQQGFSGVEDPAVAAFQTFLAADGNKAFATGADGAWGWRASTSLPLEEVQQEALAGCARHGIDCTVVITAPDMAALAERPQAD